MFICSQKMTPPFFRNTFLTLATYPSQFIIAGYFNCVLNPAIDRSSSSETSHQEARRTIKEMYERPQLCGDLETTQSN